jgi:SOS-response transcriptional repressor LexA
MKELGKTGQGLANALGINKSRISEIIGGRRGVKADEIITIAHYLEMSEREVIALLSGVSVTDMGGSSVPPGFAEPPGKPLSYEGVSSRLGLRYPGAFVPDPKDMPPPSTMPVDVPVYGTVVGGADGDFEMNGEVIDRVRRPAGLTNARNAFALYVVGSSMSPRYDVGDLIFVHPGRPPVSGSDVVVELHAKDEFGRGKALLKIYRGKTPTQLLLSQLNPARELQIPLDEVKQVWRVLRTNELLGI